MILLDTDICVDLLRGRTDVLDAYEKADQVVAISFMSVGELWYGAQKSVNRLRQESSVRIFFDAVQVIYPDLPVMLRFGELRAELELSGMRLADADLLIGATALAHDCPLVSGNREHFERIPGLHLQNWRES